MRQQRGGRTMTADQYRAAGWREERCPDCAGRGIGYAYRDRDPRLPIVGMEKCQTCGGRGSWWRSPNGVKCQYPGGPFQR
jgi:hypothetical protein